MCLFLCQYHTVLITVALQYSLMSSIVISPTMFFFLKILRLFGVVYNYIYIFEIFVLYLWNVISILIGISLNIQTASYSIDILMMLILPIHEHGTRFHLFVSSLISFFSVVQFSEYRSFTSFVWFIPRYFIFFLLYQLGFFPLISVSDISLLVYKNAFDFWILSLYPGVLPNSLIRSSGCLLYTSDAADDIGQV